MNIFVMVPPDVWMWFEDIKILIQASLIDCGHTLTNEEEADIVIVVQHFRSGEKLSGKKYIFLSTEQSVKGDLGNFGPDVVWGCDYGVEGMEYICMGWHPILVRPDDVVEKDINVGFVASGTERRRIFEELIRNKITYTNTFNYDDKVRCIHRTKICLNYHAFAPTNYTEWGRLAVLLANGAFVLSEKFYCPLPIIQFSTSEEYDILVDEYLADEKKRMDIAASLHNMYKRDFDMRDILTEKLSNRGWK